MTTLILNKWSLLKSAMTWPDTCMFYPGTKCTISPTYIIVINLESEMFRQTKSLKIGQLDYWEDFTPRPAPPRKYFFCSPHLAPPRPNPKQKRLPRTSLHLTLSQSSSYRAILIFLLVERFPFHSSLNIGFLWSPQRLSRTEAFQCTTSAGWLFLQILYKKSSKQKLLFNFCSPRRRCNKN